MASGYEKHDCGAEPGGHWPKPTGFQVAVLCVAAILYSAICIVGTLSGVVLILVTLLGR